ncbi:hypothetical protein EDD85DRAFT_796652 [Armillaria nabsnona]|nr:hypothetical protein EDD85DRAFT_796652 [Armillaria nabsnona]
MKVVVAFRCGEVESEERGGRSRMMRTTSKAGGIRAVAVVPEGRLRGRWRRRRRRRREAYRIVDRAVEAPKELSSPSEAKKGCEVSTDHASTGPTVEQSVSVLAGEWPGGFPAIDVVAEE